MSSSNNSLALDEAGSATRGNADAVESARIDHRVVGLDTFRFLAALVVMLGHGAAFPLTSILSKDNLPGAIVLGVYANLFYGPAAVIIFFVISGFCIHFPYRDLSRRLGIRYFYAGRYIRIGIPMLVVAFAYVSSFFDLRQFHNSVLWSLVAELVYYTLYPVFRIGFRKWGIARCVVASYAVAMAVVLTDPANHYYANYGVTLTWIVGLPSWLLGCLIAEQFGKVVVPAAAHVWKMRAMVIGAMWLASVMQFHSPVRDPWTMPVFSLLAYIWLREEIAYYNGEGRKPLQWLEAAGVWSYSLYLCHLPLYGLFKQHAPDFMARPTGWLIPVAWASMVIFILALSWLFYLVVERSSHRLAQVVRRRFPRWISA